MSRARTVRQTGQTVSLTRGGAIGTLNRVFQRPDKLRVEIAYPGEEAEVRILNGPQGWRRNVPVSGPLHGAMRLQAARIAMPLVLLQQRANLKDLGTETGPGGDLFRVLRLPLSSELTLSIAVEQKTARIRHSRGAIHANDRQIMEFSTTYSDFRTWDGILVAGREEQYAMGRHVGHTLIETVEVLESLEAGYFHP